eukprot:s2043_g6.t1
MGKEAKEQPKLSELYEKLTAEQQTSLSKAVTEKLQTMIGGYGELGVLVEYISVMLQSSRPPEAIQTELEAFLQDQSGPFTQWLCEKLQKVVNEGGKRRRREKRAEDGKDAKPKDAKDAEKKAKKEKKAAAQAAAQAAQTAATPTTVAARSRSRKRRRRAATASTPVTVTTVQNQADRKAKLTPNVDYMHEGRPQKSDGREAPAGSDTRWSFRADPSGHLQPSHHGHPPSAYYQAPPGAYPTPRHPHAPAVAPQYFTPKKWKVARGNTVVRKTERLDSEEVQKLQEGEIVEQVAPAITTENGIVRIQIRHPSSPLFPKPIGWVTQDASAAGGPKFLEPGPEPMQRTQAATSPSPGGWRPAHDPSPWAAGGWRPRPGPGVPPPRPVAYGKGFQNLTWTPS